MTLLLSFYVIPDILATAFSYQPRPSPGDPRDPKAPRLGPWGTPSLVQTGRKNLQKWWFFHVFPGTSPEKCLIFKDLYVFGIIFCFKTDGWDSPKKWKKRNFDFFFFEKHPAAEAQALNNCLNNANG